MPTLHRVIVRPIVTEATSAAYQERGEYYFEVDPDANKQEIKQAVERLFGVKVTGVWTMNVRGKSRRVGMRGGSMSYAGENLTVVARGTNDPAAPLACRARKQPERVCMTVPVAAIFARIGPQLTFRKNHPPAQ